MFSHFDACLDFLYSVLLLDAASMPPIAWTLVFASMLSSLDDWMFGCSDLRFETFAPTGRFLDNWMLVRCDTRFPTPAWLAWLVCLLLGFNCDCVGFVRQFGGKVLEVGDLICEVGTLGKAER
jgi:hypothetical protein